MHCLALSLDSSSNKSLFKLGATICNELKTTLLIEKFHLTLVCVDSSECCDKFISDIKNEHLNFSRITPLRWTVLEGQNTDFDYLTIEVYIPLKILNIINDTRKKYINKYYELKPHISIVKGPKGSFSKKFVDNLNKEIILNSHIYADKLLHFFNFELVDFKSLDCIMD